MSVTSEVPPSAQPMDSAGAAPPESPRATLKPRGRTFRGVHLAWSVALAAILMQSIATSVIVLGWAMRLVRRAVLASWWRASPRVDSGESLEQFLASHEELAHLTHTPGTIPFSLRGIWLNVGQGVLGAVNLGLATLLPCTLWSSFWYDGWNNSFHKGYEQAYVGPSVSLVGIGIFCILMLYAPIAFARQSATGSWRAFWDVSVVRRIVRERFFACFGLACLTSLAGIPIMVMRIWPMFFEQMGWTDPDWSRADLARFAEGYFFLCSLYVLAAFLFLRLLAGWIYGSALASAVRGGRIERHELSAREVMPLWQLGLLEVDERRQTNWFLRFLSWTGGRAARITCAVLGFLVWFTLAAQLYVSQFFLYIHPAWFQHPLLHLPWFKWIPPGLVD